jgi:aspartate/glutamate racemase
MSTGLAAIHLPDAIARKIEEFGLFCLALLGNIAAMSDSFPRRDLEGRRIRPEKPAFNYGFFQYTSR